MTPLAILLDYHQRLDPPPDGYVTQAGLFAKHQDGSLWIPMDAQLHDGAQCWGPCIGDWRSDGRDQYPEDAPYCSVVGQDDHPLIEVKTGRIMCGDCAWNDSPMQWLYLDQHSRLWVEEHGDTYQLDGMTYYHDADHPCAWYTDHDDYEDGQTQEEYYTSPDYEGQHGHTMFHHHETDEWLCWDCVGLEEVG